MRIGRSQHLWLGVLLLIVFVGGATAADDSTLAARAAAWEKEYNAGNLEAVAAMYTADGCRMPPNTAKVQGTAAILAQLKKGVEMGGARIKVTVTSAETSGDMGHGAGTYELSKADGSHLDHGKWMNVSRKVSGTWKIECDIWNSDMPLPAAPAKQ